MPNKPSYEDLEKRVRELELAEANRITAQTPYINSVADYRTIFDTANDAFLIHDLRNARVIEVNQAMLEMFGYTKEEVLQKDVELLSSGAPPYSKVEIRKHIQRVVLGEPHIFDWLARKKNGELFWIEVSLKSVTLAGEECIIAIIRDIDERRQKEEALQKNEKKYKSILQTAVDGFWLSDMQGHLLEVNDAYCRMSGYCKEELLSMHISQLEGNMGPQDIADKIDEVYREGYIRFETRHRHKDGHCYHIEVSVQYLPIEDGKLVIFMRDISDQKKLEDNLEDKNAQFEAIFSSITDAIVFVDTQRHIVMVNPAFTVLFGYSSNEVQGKKTQFLYADPDDYSRQGTVRFNVQAEVNRPVYQIEYRRKNGSSFFSETLGVPVRDNQGELIGFLAIIRDISDRIEAEQKIQENRKKLEAALSSMTDGVFISDAAGELVEFNEAWAVFSRFGSKEKCFRHLRDYPALFEVFLPNGDPAPVESWAISRALRGEIKTNVEYHILRKDTGERWVGSYSFAPIRNEQGTIVGSVVVARDITELKKKEAASRQLEDRLRQAQKMESIGALAGGIAHDFNNLLAVILGYAGIAKKDAPSGTNIEKDLDQILHATSRAKELVAQILTFSRQSQVERVPLKLYPIINESLKMLRSSIPTTVSIVKHLDPKSGTVLADPTQVHQILMNLCTNAYQSMEPTGGTLTVSLRPTMIDAEHNPASLSLPPGEYMEITVADTGTGIKPDIIEKIFDPYFTTKEIGKGTGMGLAIIHGIMQEHDGAISVESQPGEGTTFHVFFPVIKQAVYPKNHEIEEVPTGSERILFVDDEKSLLEMGKLMLENLGYSVSAHSKSLEALEEFKKNPNRFDLVITDQTMPELTGSELSRKILEIRQGMPILLCTGHSNLINENSAKAIGVKEFALKPLTINKTAKLIRKILDASRSQTE